MITNFRLLLAISVAVVLLATTPLLVSADEGDLALSPIGHGTVVGTDRARSADASVDGSLGDGGWAATMQRDDHELVASVGAVEIAGRAVPAPAGMMLDLLFVASQPAEYKHYRRLNSWNTRVSMRSREWAIDGPEISALAATGTPYYFTAGSSDYIMDGIGTIYETTADVVTMLGRPNCRGVYLHEMTTYLASINDYDWTAGTDAFDWAWLDTVVAAAAAANKRVIWSEAAQGWPTMHGNATAIAHLSTYDPARLVPMFATNFWPRTLVDDAQAGATATAALYGMKLGMSHQVWWWLDGGATITRAESRALAERGIAAEATVIEVAGPPPYMTWGDPYLGGIEDFATARSGPPPRSRR